MEIGAVPHAEPVTTPSLRRGAMGNTQAALQGPHVDCLGNSDRRAVAIDGKPPAGWCESKRMVRRTVPSRTEAVFDFEYQRLVDARVPLDRKQQEEPIVADEEHLLLLVEAWEQSHSSSESGSVQSEQGDYLLLVDTDCLDALGVLDPGRQSEVLITPRMHPGSGEPRREHSSVGGQQGRSDDRSSCSEQTWEC